MGYYDLSKFIPLSTIDLDEVARHANAGDCSALYLGSYLALLVGLDRETELLWASEGAKRGDFLCKAKLAIMQWNGYTIAQDRAAALKNIKDSLEQLGAAATQDNPYAVSILAIIYFYGVGIRPDVPKALAFYEKAIALGEVYSAYNVGMFYEEGRRVEKDHAKAEKYYRIAAERGHTKSLHSLGLLLANHLGNPEEAYALWRQAADQDYGPAQYQLGVWYAGQFANVAPDPTEAYTWYCRAERNGDLKAKEAVAACLQYGKGTERNRAAALMHYLELRDSAHSDFVDKQIQLLAIAAVPIKDGGRVGLCFVDGDIENIAWGITKEDLRNPRRTGPQRKVRGGKFDK
jgi:TPR repeat protein